MPFSIMSPRSFVQIARGVDQSQSTMKVSLERLSSGLRINRSADDAAGLAISERLSSKIRGALASVQNMNMGTSLLQVIDGALNESQAALMRMRELSVISANETLTENEREALNTEFQLLSAQLDMISEQTNFNGIKLLDGKYRNLELQIGSGAEDVFRVGLCKATASELGRQARYTTQRRGVFISDIATGDMKINGVNIRATGESDDELSYSFGSGSAIAKAKAINHSTQFTGVRAIVGHNVISGFEPIREIELDPQSFFKVNGYAITAIKVEAKDATGVLVDSINAGYAETGVVAHVDAEGKLILTAEDGRNITVEYGDGTVRDAIRMIDFNGDPINLVNTVDPVIYDLDGDIESVDFVFNGGGNYNQNYTITGDAIVQTNVNTYTTNDATGGYERPRDNVDFVLEIVDPGPVGVATYRFKEESIANYAIDSLPENYLFNAEGSVVSQTSTHVSVESATHYNEASDRTYTLTVERAGLPSATNAADLPTFSYTVFNNDTGVLEETHFNADPNLNIVADLGSPITLSHNLVIDFPVGSKSAEDVNGVGDATLNLHEDIRANVSTGSYNDNPRFVSWNGDRVTDFTFTVTSAGHAAGSTAISGSNTTAATLHVEAYVRSLNTTYTDDFAIDPTVGNWDSISFKGMEIEFFGRKGSVNDSDLNGVSGSYKGTFDSTDSVYVGTETRKYVITMADGGKISGSSNLEASVAVKNSVGGTLSSHTIFINSGTAYQLGEGADFEGILVDFTASSSVVGNVSDQNGAPDVVNKRNNNYNGSDDEIGILEIVNGGRVNGSATYKYYYSGDDPNSPLNSGNLTSGVLTLSDGVQLNISSSDPPEFSSLNKGGLDINNEDASGYTEEQDASFTANVVDLGGGNLELQVSWTFADATVDTITHNVTAPGYVGSPLDIGYGVDLTFDTALALGDSFNGGIEANELDGNDYYTFTLKSGRVEIGDTFTVDANPRTLAVGDKWEVTGVVPEWNVGDTFVINADHNFIDQAPQTLTNTVNLVDPNTGAPLMGTVNLTGAGNFETGDEIRIRTRGFTGTATSGGHYTDNLYPTNYIITITKEGPIGIAEFEWIREDERSELPDYLGQGTGVTSAGGNALERGITILFEDGAAGQAYLSVGDQFIIPAGQKLEYTFAGDITLQSDGNINIEHVDLDAVNNFGRFLYEGDEANEAGTEGNLLVGDLGANVEISVDDLNILTVLSAEEAIDTLDEAIDQISNSRSDVGAAMNRLESRIQSSTVYINELSRARQRIRDTDFAVEVSELTRARTQQGAAPMLAQVAKLELQRALLLLESVIN